MDLKEWDGGGVCMDWIHLAMLENSGTFCEDRERTAVRSQPVHCTAAVNIHFHKIHGIVRLA
jgi:hypothetical protein